MTHTHFGVVQDGYRRGCAGGAGVDGQRAYEYDGHDRLLKIRFPNPSGGGSSATDYEQYTYDAGSNVIQDRRRDGTTISFAYDNLNRAATMSTLILN